MDNSRFKFRVWDKEDKKFLDHLSIDLSADGILILWRLEGKKYINLNDNNRYLLMQCTGLKDKNGKLIYEGDIIQIQFDSDGIAGPYSVVWDCEEYAFMFKPIKGDDYDCDRHLYEFSVNRIQIIGNIHKNPELLEDNNDF